MDRHTTPRRLIGADAVLWTAFGAVVGNSKRSADLRHYMAWRVNNPHAPLPGERFVPHADHGDGE